MRETQWLMPSAGYANSPEREATRGTSVPLILVCCVMWIFNILYDRFTTDVTCRANEIATCPERGKFFKMWKLISQIFLERPLKSFITNEGVSVGLTATKRCI
jgi:hypothetical protein